MTKILFAVFAASVVVSAQALASGAAQETVLGHVVMVERSFKPEIDACSATLKASPLGGYACEVKAMESAPTDLLISGDEKDYTGAECQVYAMASMSGYVLNLTGKKPASFDRDRALACLRESFEKKFGNGMRLKAVFQSVR